MHPLNFHFIDCEDILYVAFVLENGLILPLSRFLLLGLWNFVTDDNCYYPCLIYRNECCGFAAGPNAKM